MAKNVNGLDPVSKTVLGTYLRAELALKALDMTLGQRRPVGFIEGWYNPHRRHSALDYLSPINYERSHQSQTDFRSPTPSTESG